MKMESCLVNNLLHRESGPAWISYDGNKRYEIYYINRKFHREDGFAFICYYENGDKENERYCYKGEEVLISSLEEYLMYVEERKLKDYFE